MAQVYIGIGGNLGDREANLEKAVDALSPYLQSIRVSRLYRTDPMDYLDQDYFLNIVVRGETSLSPGELLKVTQAIEDNGGRVREGVVPKGPRTIDLDILLYDDRVIRTEDLTIPHPSMHLRKFVLLPLLELDSGIRVPGTGESYYMALQKIGHQGVYCSSLNLYNNCFV